MHPLLTVHPSKDLRDKRQLMQRAKPVSEDPLSSQPQACQPGLPTCTSWESTQGQHARAPREGLTCRHMHREQGKGTDRKEKEETYHSMQPAEAQSYAVDVPNPRPSGQPLDLANTKGLPRGCQHARNDKKGGTQGPGRVLGNSGQD